MLKKILPAAIVLCATGLLAFIEYPVSAYGDEASLISEKGYDPIVVLELFTSQGCSSCPAADLLLNQVKATAGKSVFTLSYHVDYWNYIGWEDPFSSPHYSKKQELYNYKFKNRGNYTPQLVINGREHLVGSNSTRLYSKIATYKTRAAMNRVMISAVQKKADNINFEYLTEGDISNKNIKALLVLDERITHVKRGENRNKTLVNSNIVILEKVAKLYSNQGNMTLKIPKSIGSGEVIQLVVLVENDIYDISAAAKIKL